MARHWTGNCTIALTGTGKSYSPVPWAMSGPNACDREHKTKDYIKATWLDTGAIWKLLGMNTTEQNQWCGIGNGTFRIDYGFDKRPKEWNFTQTIPTRCACPVPMVFA